MTELAAKVRDPKGNLKVLRQSGEMPAIMYGPKNEALPISVPQIDFIKAWREAGESTVVTLKGLSGEDQEVLIHDVDVDPLKEFPRHADFYIIDRSTKIQVDVPIEYIGEAPAVKQLGAGLVKVLHEIEVEALPKDLPHGIVVDLSGLVQIDDHILVKDISMPAGVTALSDPEAVVVTAAAQQEEEESEPMDISSIEVEKKGKEEAEEETKSE